MMARPETSPLSKTADSNSGRPRSSPFEVLVPNRPPVELLRSGVLAIGLGLIACTSGGSTTPAPTVSSVTVAPATASVVAGQSTQLAANVVVSNGAATTVTWSSGNTAIATVGSTGMVQGVSAGTTTIVATSTVNPSKQGTATVTVTPAPQYLYVGDDNATGSLRVYLLPLTANSTPVATVPMNKAFTMGANSTTLAVATLDGTLSFFNLPITSSSTPYASFAAGSDGTPLFFSETSLYQGGSGKINIYSAPFASSSVPSGSVTTAGLSPADLARDPAGNVYETGGDNTIGVVTGGTLTTTMTAVAGTAFRGMAASATQLFVAGFNGAANNLYIYALPLTAASTPAVTINLGSTIFPEGVALDANGNLYVGAFSQLLVFAPPFGSSSVPMVNLTTTALIFGIAVR
jgi:hypothetical protein